MENSQVLFHKGYFFLMIASVVEGYYWWGRKEVPLYGIGFLKKSENLMNGGSTFYWLLRCLQV
jgi:hypothetical protein